MIATKLTVYFEIQEVVIYRLSDGAEQYQRPSCNWDK